MGKSLRELLGVCPEVPLTHREYLAWQAWLQDQWNEPDRSDHYLMQIAYCVGTVLAKKPPAFESETYKIPFAWKEAVSEQPKLTQQEAATQSKSRWAAMLSGLFVGKRKK